MSFHRTDRSLPSPAQSVSASGQFLSCRLFVVRLLVPTVTSFHSCLLLTVNRLNRIDLLSQSRLAVRSLTSPGCKSTPDRPTDGRLQLFSHRVPATSRSQSVIINLCELLLLLFLYHLLHIKYIIHLLLIRWKSLTVLTSLAGLSYLHAD